MVIPVPNLVNGGTHVDAWDRLRDEGAAASSGDRVVVVWSGHGDPKDGSDLLTEESPKNGNRRRQLPARRRTGFGYQPMAGQAPPGRARRLLLKLGAVAIGQKLLEAMLRSEKQPGPARYVSIVSTASPFRTRTAVMVPEALTRLLVDNDAGRSWGDQNCFIRVNQLAGALAEALAKAAPAGRSRWRSPASASGMSPSPAAPMARCRSGTRRAKICAVARC
jgi:hypothetical protein